MSEFATPSCIVPHTTGLVSGYWLFRGQGGHDTHGYQLLWSPAQTDATKPLVGFSTVEFTQSGTASGAPWITKNGAYRESWPYACAIDEETTIFIYAGNEGGKDGIFAHVFVGENRVVACQQVDDSDFARPSKTLPLTPHIGASSIPGELGVLIAYWASSGQLKMVYCQWQPDGQSGGTLVRTGNLLGTVIQYNISNGEVSLCAVANAVNPTPQAPFFMAYLGMTGVDKSHPYQIWLTIVSIALDSALGANRIPVLAFGGGGSFINYVDPKGNPGKHISFFRGADGVAYFQGYLNDFQSGPIPYPEPSQQCYFTPVDYSLISWDPIGSPADMKASQPGAVFYAFSGAFDKAPNNTVDVYRVFIFDDAVIPIVGYMEQALQQLVGQATRSAMPPINTIAGDAGLQGILVGVIEGGPPVPNENIQGRNLSEDSTFNMLSYGVTTTNSTDWKVQATIGTFIKANASGDVPLVASITCSSKIAMGVTGELTGQSGIINITTVQALSQGVSINGNKAINPTGIALILQPVYVGWIYTFLDVNGAPINAQVIQVYVGPDSVTTPFPYEMDPNASGGIIPGELYSYNQCSTIPTNVFSGLDNKPSCVTCSFVNGGNQTTGSYQLAGGSKSVGGYFNTEQTIGASVGSDADGAKANIEAGVTFKCEFNYSWLQSEEDSLTCVPNMDSISQEDEQTYHSYSKFSFNAVMLQHDASYTQDLISLLQNYQTSDNLHLLAAISPQSVPWKITYYVYGAYQPSLAAATPPDDLISAGIHNASMAVRVYTAAEAGIESAAAASPGERAADIDRQVAAELSAVQKSSLATYMQQLQELSYQQFLKRHPNWKRRASQSPIAIKATVGT